MVVGLAGEIEQGVAAAGNQGETGGLAISIGKEEAGWVAEETEEDLEGAAAARGLMGQPSEILGVARFI